MRYIENGENLRPRELWANFDKLLGVPRPSKKEIKIAKFMKEFGESLGLETTADELGNVIIKKPATSGMENHKTIVLQSHLDMVPQKNSDKIHDFENDPIEAYIDGNNVTAAGTTLGADNGIGIAATMAILQSKNIKHGPIEALFTADEEVGMTGAFGLKTGLLKGDILINTDSEEDGELFIGSAGGIDTNVEFRYKEKPVPSKSATYKILVSGLKGGHSGSDIHLGRGNSNKIINRILWNINKIHTVSLSSINGGGTRNVIPRESTATVIIPETSIKKFERTVSEQAKEIKSVLKAVETDLKIEFEKVNTPKTVMDKDSQDKLLNAIYAIPNGVIRMSDCVPGLVETSTNLAQVISEGNAVKIRFLTRSSLDSEKFNVCNIIQSVCDLVGADVKHSGPYPGWAPDIKSEILNLSAKLYRELFKSEPKIKAIHAGLECSLFKIVYPDMDMISFGPTIRCAHSPDEYVDIKSVGKFWKLFVSIIENVPKK